MTTAAKKIADEQDVMREKVEASIEIPKEGLVTTEWSLECRGTTGSASMDRDTAYLSLIASIAILLEDSSIC